jgi:hypothetical protein
MTATSEKQRHNGTPSASELRPATTVPPKMRRRPGLLVAGVAMVAVGALAVMWLVTSTGHRREVVVTARDVEYGATITAGDLSTTAVAVDPAVAVIPASREASLIGRVATAHLARGSLLTESDAISMGVLSAGQVLVPLPLTSAKVPADGLRAGDRLVVVDAPPAGADPIPGDPQTFAAQVVRVGSPDVNGTVVVDVVASSHDGPALATRAATGRFAILVEPTSPR